MLIFLPDPLERKIPLPTCHARGAREALRGGLKIAAGGVALLRAAKGPERAGFVDASVVEVPLKWRAPSIEAIIDFIYKGAVRTAAVLERQTPDAIDRIHRAIREGAERFMRDGAYEMAWPAVLAAARKPHS